MLASLSGIAALSHWLFWGKESPLGTPDSGRQEVELPKETPFLSPVRTDNEIIFRFSEEELLSMKDFSPESLAETLELEGQWGEDRITGIIIENTTQGKPLILREVFDLFSIETPEGFWEKVENKFTFFAHSLEQEKRMGFVIKLKNQENISGLVTSWEETLEADFGKIFSVTGKQESEEPFLDANYKGTSFRYIPSLQRDFEICWGIKNNYLIITSSGKSMLKIIEKLTE